VARYHEGTSVDDVFQLMKVVSLRMGTVRLYVTLPSSFSYAPATPKDDHVGSTYKGMKVFLGTQQ